MHNGHDLDLSRSCDVIGHVTIQLALCSFNSCRWSVDIFSYLVCLPRYFDVQCTYPIL